MRPTRIAILGTRGIPNHYGGFEYAAEKIAAALVLRGHEVTVYCSHNHPCQQSSWQGVRLIHCYDPEQTLGVAGQFVYDLHCIGDARKRKFEVILMFGYTSNSIWGSWYPKESVIITNMDGLEWKREKYSKPVRLFLKHAERLAIRHSDFYIADSRAIQQYLREKYGIRAGYIPYGAEPSDQPAGSTDTKNTGKAKKDFLLMARMEPENNVETILDGFHNSQSSRKFTVIGNIGNRFGKYLVGKFRKDLRIEFAGAVFDQQRVSRLLAQAYIYFHGHSVGGTNPSLLQAMASKALIASHHNPFNSAILKEDALYFSDARDVQHIIDHTRIGEKEELMICNNLKKIKDEFNWEGIVDQYEHFIIQCYEEHQR
jgi:glycosyltransferase involved in cell wall biosynthesis